MIKNNKVKKINNLSLGKLDEVIIKPWHPFLRIF
jgi:hypothetical protein